MVYNRLNPAHWLLSIFSNSRKNLYLKSDTYHVNTDQIKATQRILYWFRNPFHDFSCYIVGFQDEPLYITVKGNEMDTLKEGWIVAIRNYRFLYLPYIAYQKTFKKTKFQFYFGWRPLGNFGVKARFTNGA